MKTFLKIIIIIIAIVLLIGLGYWLWNKFIGPAPTLVGVAPPALPAGKAGEIGPGFNLASAAEIFDYWVKPGGEIYAVAQNGEILRISPSGEEKISSQTIANLHSVSASPDGHLAVISFGYPFQETFALFDTRNNSWQALPANTTAAAWDPQSSNRLAYLKTSGKTGSLNLLTLNDQKAREIMKIVSLDLEMNWLAPDTIYLSEKPAAQFKGLVWAVNIVKKTVQSVIPPENGLMTAWAPDGSFALKSASQEKNLLVVNNRNQTLAKLNFSTIADKCAIDQKNIYCAVPKNLEGISVIWPDDYLKKKIYTEDDLTQIPLILGIDDRLNDLAIPLLVPLTADISKIKISGDQLYFINRYDSKLYSLAL
jgi:hypothetical protein